MLIVVRERIGRTDDLCIYFGFFK